MIVGFPSNDYANMISRSSTDVVKREVLHSLPLDRHHPLIRVEDALITGTGAFLALVPFGLSLWDFAAASFFIFLGFLSAVTPDVFDTETQYANYLSKHTSRVHNLLSSLICFPQLYSYFLMFASHSHWLTLSASFFSLYYIFADRTIAGFIAVSVTLAFRESTMVYAASHGGDSFTMALMIHLLCWIVQIIGLTSLEASGISFSQTVKQNFLQIILISPLMVINDILLYLGFNKGLARRSKSTLSNIKIERKIRSISE